MVARQRVMWFGVTDCNCVIFVYYMFKRPSGQLIGVTTDQRLHNAIILH